MSATDATRDMMQALAAMRFPLVSPAVRRHAIENDMCPQCSGLLDVGWECNDCGFDAMPEAKKE
ncbi:hypothetical protein [Burkholderia ubonensis]|uniref:hypothetical protein n=1 Tax=Burkholderia ubonensis TaxID=101571 RepID=UPI000754042D|nr:hypothetical protein [Burkholderia ubonensis]KVC81406.1 hypothetical protein WI75_08645 [Burkholderia ubonensis]